MINSSDVYLQPSAEHMCAILPFRGQTDIVLSLREHQMTDVARQTVHSGREKGSVAEIFSPWRVRMMVRDRSQCKCGDLMDLFDSFCFIKFKHAR